jgi:small-conductance mechanosensitive channel
MAGFAPIDLLITYDLAEAMVIILFALLTAIMINVFMKRIVSAITQKTKTTLDDNLAKAVKRPIFLGTLLFGLYLALASISYLAPHMAIISKVIKVLGLLIIFYFIHRIIYAVVRWYSSELSVKIRGKESKQLSIFGKIADILLVLVFGLVLLWYLGINITPFVAGLGIGGLAVALALQETLSNFIAGLSIIGDRSIKVGDYVELENGQLGGYIEDISWRTSRFRTLGGDYIIVPNNKLSQSITKDYNFGAPETFTGVDMMVSYRSDLDKVERLTMKVAKEVQDSVEGAVRGYQPIPRFKRLGESNIEFSIALKVSKFSDQYAVKSEFIKRIKKAFDRNKIDISPPVRYVYNMKR